MDNNFAKIRDFLLELECTIVSEVENDSVFVIEHEQNGIKNMVVACADPIVIIEQQLFSIKKDSMEMYKTLLQKNRDIIHGAFVIDETGTNVLFRDTLQIENLDINELEGTLNSFSLLLSEYSDEIIGFSA